MPIVTLTQENFDEHVKDNTIVLLDFWAEWCSPCLAFAETYQSVADEYPDIVFGKINTEEQPELAADFNVRSIPLIMVMKEQVVVFSESGTMPASSLKDLIEQAKALDMTEIKKKIEDAS